jgi:ribonuclease T2
VPSIHVSQTSATRPAVKHTPFVDVRRFGFALIATCASMLALAMPATAQERVSPMALDSEQSTIDRVDYTDFEVTYSNQRQSLIAKAAAGQFDYYLLSMSWSPNYCLTHANELQCTSKKAFILHGLWPENLSGANPSTCPSQQTLTQTAIDVALPYMTSKTLIQHEWDKHGVCAGKTSVNYFTDAVNAFKAVRVPSYLATPKATKTISLSTLRKDFQASSGLAANQYAVVCDGSKLKEVRVCLNKQFAAQACGSGVSDSCPSTLTIDAPK